MKKIISQIISTLSVVTFMLFAGQVYSASLPSNITPQQMEQFKKLPPSQQKALAQSMGIDLSAIQGSLNKKTLNGEDDGQQQYYPRGTMFDDMGNPILAEQDNEAEIEEDDGQPKPFGYDVFANAPATFSPIVDIAIPSNYILGAGDTLSIQMFGKENAEYQLPVSREGKVVIPQLGAFTVSGLTFSELKNYLGNEIKNKVLGVDVVITLDSLRSTRVFVLGDAFKPGPYVLNALSSITHALFAAGGINDIGSLRNIQLKRAGKLITTLDLYDLLIKGDSSNDLVLKSGDVIFIPPVGERVTLIGEVTRPAIYELAPSRNNHQNETFASAVKMAGGLLPTAYPASTVVERFNNNNLRSLLNIDLSKPQYLKQKIKNGDFIRVMKTSEQFDQSITVIGAVSRPGKYQWKSKQQIVDLLPNINAYVLEDADLTYGLVVRETGIGRNIEIHQFSLFNAVSNHQSKDNIALQPRDRILIFSNVEKNTNEYMSLDSLALTEQEILDKEKLKAKDKFEDRMFWLEYGENNPSIFEDEYAQTQKLATASLQELTGGTVEDVIDIRELALFSRKRLLGPVIEQLTRQASTGHPVQLLEVVGAVKFPGIYPLAVNNKVDQLIAAAGGLLESAYLGKAEITRNHISLGVANKTSMNIDLGSALKNEVANNVSLQSKDRVNVHSIPSWQENHTVELRGEFMFPGKYTIRRGETLSQLIERSGGYTQYAYQDASVFTREKLKQLERQNLLKVSESLRTEIASKSLAQSNGSQVDYEQAKLLLADLTKVTPVGRLVVNLPKIAADDNFDVLLENGDILYVPTKQNSINVIGQVQVATSHMFQPSLSAEEYISLSGGIKQQADDSRIYVIKANGSVEIPSSGNWFAAESEGGLKPGDTVVVPLDSDYMNNMTLWSTGTQIVYQAAVAIAAISGI